MKPMRRSDRQKDAVWAFEVFDKAPYVTVSMTRPDGTPYGLPLSFARWREYILFPLCRRRGEAGFYQTKSHSQSISCQQMYSPL